MKIIRENNDLTIGLNLELYKINYSLVQSINFIFYTDNVFMGVYKTMEDVDIYNNIKLLLVKIKTSYMNMKFYILH